MDVKSNHKTADEAPVDDGLLGDKKKRKVDCPKQDSTTPQNVHTGHRARLRQRYLQTGLTGMAQHNVLELLLFTILPQRDTNGLAHALLAKYGTLQGVLEASCASLMSVKGVGEQTAVFLHMAGELSKLYHAAWFTPTLPYLCTADYAAYLEGLFIGKQEEILVVLYFNHAGKLLLEKQITLGGRSTLLVEERTILDGALAVNATHIVLAHNHPGGIAVPSREDILMTKQLIQRLGGVGLQIIDHFIFAGENFLSMAEMGYFNANMP